MRVLVCGDRRWSDRAAIERELNELPFDATIIHGGATGADTLAGEIATDWQMPVVVFPAEWEKHGKAAGPIRNSRMLAEGKPDRVLAFHKFLPGSKGTADMVRKAKAAGVPVEVFEG